ncbi:MAG: hypothetical protein HY706_05430 [Candidatus Hydrogenedentes bacterium]|nr:hypothetical protein [Candidatus Hydrogenedentota bacterium]
MNKKVRYNEPALTTAHAEYLIRRMSRELREGAIPHLDLSPFGHLDLGAIVNLLAFVFAASEGRLPYKRPVQPPTMDLPIDIEVRDFLFKMEFFHLTQYSYVSHEEVIRGANVLAREEQAANSRRRLDGRYPFMPLREVVSKVSEYSSPADFESHCRKFISSLQNTFGVALESHLNFQTELVEEFWLPNKEIVENIYMHSASWGLGAIQCSERGALICYMDIGQGMRTTLDNRKEQLVKLLGETWNDNLAIRGAFVRGVTSVCGSSRGIGLAKVRNYVSECGGNIECRSGSGKVVYSANGANKGWNVEWIPGVQIRIWLPAPVKTPS